MSTLFECMSCGATGLYQGFCEEKGYPVVCVNCNGTGARDFGRTPYTGRKLREGVKGVRVNPTGMIISAGSKQTSSYERFLREHPEPK